VNNRQAKAIRRAYRDFRNGKAPDPADAAVMRRLLDEGDNVVRVVNREHARIKAGGLVKMPEGWK
jgi:DnaJ-domain-containing protein 1